MYLDPARDIIQNVIEMQLLIDILVIKQAKPS